MTGALRCRQGIRPPSRRAAAQERQQAEPHGTRVSCRRAASSLQTDPSPSIHPSPILPPHSRDCALCASCWARLCSLPPATAPTPLAARQSDLLPSAILAAACRHFICGGASIGWCGLCPIAPPPPIPSLSLLPGHLPLVGARTRAAKKQKKIKRTAASYRARRNLCAAHPLRLWLPCAEQPVQAVDLVAQLFGRPPPLDRRPRVLRLPEPRQHPLHARLVQVPLTLQADGCER